MEAFRDVKGLVSEGHSRGIRSTNLRLLGADMDAVLEKMQQEANRGKRSRSAAYRRLVKEFLALQCEFGFSAEHGERKNRQFSGFFFNPDVEVGLVSMISFVPLRAPIKFDVFTGPLVVRRHALDRLHQRRGVLDAYETWAEEFRITLRTVLLLFGQQGYWIADSPDALLPTKHGALLGLFQNNRFIGRTWLHSVDLDLDRRVEVQRILARVEQEKSPGPEQWSKLLAFAQSSEPISGDQATTE